MYCMPLHTTSLQFPQLFEDFAVKMFKAIKCKNVSATRPGGKYGDSWNLSQPTFVNSQYSQYISWKSWKILFCEVLDKEVQIVYRLFLVNCYLLHVLRLPFQLASSGRG